MSSCIAFTLFSNCDLVSEFSIIIPVVAFITIPNFPMAALIAAAIATSGDGFFPLIAENRKDTVCITQHLRQKKK